MRERNAHKRSRSQPMMNASQNPNRNLVRIFCLSLSGLLLVYAVLGVYGLVTLESDQRRRSFRSA